MLIFLNTMNQSFPVLGKFVARQGLAGKRSETQLAVPVWHALSDPLFVMCKPCNALQKQAYLGCFIAKIRLFFLVKLDPPPRPARLKAISSEENAFLLIPKEHGETPQIDMGTLAQSMIELVLR
jgi:hypothetical protein